MIRISLSLLIDALKDSTSLILSNLRKFPGILNGEVIAYYTVDIPLEEVDGDSAEAKEQAIYGYSA